MTTPSSGPISMDQVDNELAFVGSNESMAGFYGIAPNTGGSALMFHNLSMASGNATTAKVAIWDNYNAGTNYKLSNWYNYTRDAQVVMTYSVTNNSAYPVGFDLVIFNSSGANVGTIYSAGGGSPLNGGGTTASGTSTGPSALGTIGSSGYSIAIQGMSFQPGPFSPPPFFPTVTFSVTVTINSASDTDGVGGGTTRTTYGTFTYSETASQPPTPPTNPFPAVVVDTSGGPIAINKRTSVTITIS